MSGSSEFPTNLDTFLSPNGEPVPFDSGPVRPIQWSELTDVIRAMQLKIGTNHESAPICLDTAARHRRQDIDLQNGEALIHKAVLIIRVTTSSPAWVRLYLSPAYQAADANRLIDEETPVGVLVEVITTDNQLSVELSPAAVCYSADERLGMPVVIVPTGPAPVTVTLTIIPIEV